jgi:hypothetical protein
MSPPLSDFNIRLHFRTLLWGSLLFTSHSQAAAAGTSTRCTLTSLVVVGTPIQHAPLTRTVTVTVAYKPTLSPGDSSYKLVGCYGQTGLDGKGAHPFGTEKDFASPTTVDERNLTVGACLNGCNSLKPPNGTIEHFPYVGLKNGRYGFLAVALNPSAWRIRRSRGKRELVY